jgi:hypothetical protein
VSHGEVHLATEAIAEKKKADAEEEEEQALAEAVLLGSSVGSSEEEEEERTINKDDGTTNSKKRAASKDILVPVVTYAQRKKDSDLFKRTLVQTGPLTFFLMAIPQKMRQVIIVKQHTERESLWKLLLHGNVTTSEVWPWWTK